MTSLAGESLLTFAAARDALRSHHPVRLAPASSRAQPRYDGAVETTVIEAETKATTLMNRHTRQLLNRRR